MQKLKKKFHGADQSNQITKMSFIDLQSKATG